ncbi:unnamed protein product [Periconia digitata]|uniref:Uncharacterized protein n=1 Tax=Periconia digitata TaxID=1303443 RepID=A0A9W4XGI9_9PLEO|nr:unnamed protein product [Periconia digitata]
MTESFPRLANLCTLSYLPVPVSGRASLVFQQKKTPPSHPLLNSTRLAPNLDDSAGWETRLANRPACHSCSVTNAPTPCCWLEGPRLWNHVAICIFPPLPFHD